MKKKYLLLIAIVGLASCETIVEIDVPREPSKLVANGFINPDSTIGLRISQSKYVLDNTDLQFLAVKHANVSVFENNELAGKMTTDTTAGAGWYTSDVKPLPGKEYTLQIAAEGFDPVETYATIPHAVPIDQVNFTTKQVENGMSCIDDSCTIFYSTAYDFELMLTDPSDQENYYEISAVVEETILIHMYDSTGTLVGYDTSTINSPVYLYSEDPVLQDGNFTFGEEGYYGESILFTDDVFDGKQYTIRFSTDNLPYYGMDYGIKRKFHIYLKTTDENRYLYLRSRQVQFDNEGNPFAEPVNVYSNVFNGYGIFGSYHADTYTIVIDE